jgi:hypothetical protein
MKKFTIMMLLALAVIGSSASAYNYTVVNKTNQKITVSVTPTAGPTYSWVLAPSGTTISASEAAPSSLIVPQGIDDIPGAEFSDTKVFKFTGINSGLCLNEGSFKVNGKTAEFTRITGEDLAIEIIGGIGSFGIMTMADYCGDNTISISQNAEGSFIAVVGTSMGHKN